MALNIKNGEVEAAARELARRTGESLTETVLKALRERLARTDAEQSSLREELADIRKRCARLRVRDARSPDEILGYDDQGIAR